MSSFLIIKGGNPEGEKKLPINHDNKMYSRHRAEKIARRHTDSDVQFVDGQGTVIFHWPAGQDREDVSEMDFVEQMDTRKKEAL